jgi:hypothetical protein
VRLAAARSKRAIDLRGSAISMSDLIAKTERFIEANPEGGKRGQAFVAAAFDLASASVRSARINDPSRRMPGDVQVLEGPLAVLAVEVRQKRVTYEEGMQFAASLRSGNVATGLIAMLDPAQPDLNVYDLMVEAESTHGVFLTISYGVYDVLRAATVWCGQSLAVVLDEFPRKLLERLEEIEASTESREEWSDLFSE